MADNGGSSGTGGAANTRVSPFLYGIDLAEVDAVQRGFINSVRLAEREWTATTTPTEIQEAMAEMFSPDELFNSAVAIMPGMYRELRKHLDKHGAALGVHPSHRVPPLLADRLFVKPEDRERPAELARSLVAQGRRVAADARPQHEQPQPAADDGRANVYGPAQERALAHNISMRLKDRASKFSGGADEVWTDLLVSFQNLARDYRLTPEQRL